jgi:hypothetical protein
VNEDKNQRLAQEITAFCKERLKPSSGQLKRPSSLLRTALASFLALALVEGSGPTKGEWWTKV